MCKILLVISFTGLLHSTYLKVLKKIKLPLSGVEKVICDEEKKLYILNWDKSLLLKIDASGNILDSIIKGKGEDIGKGKFLADVVYDERDGNILVSDLMLHRISEFDKNGKFINILWRNELFGNIGICGDTVFIRVLEEDKRIDSLTYEAVLMKKIDRENGKLLGEIVKEVMNKEIDDFFSMPFCIDCKNKLIYMIFPPDKIQIRKLDGSLIYEITNKKWLFVQNLVLLKNYLVISSFSEDRRSYIPQEMSTYWKSVSTNQGVRKEVIKRRLFKLNKESSPMSFEEVSYVVDIFDIYKNKFVLEGYLPPGRLVGGKGKEIFFVSKDTLFIVNLK